MKKISEEEFQELKMGYQGRKSVVRLTIEKMEAGEIYKIEPGDWHAKKNPSYLCRILETKRKRKYEVITLANKTGWVIKRVR